MQLLNPQTWSINIAVAIDLRLFLKYISFKTLFYDAFVMSIPGWSNHFVHSNHRNHNICVRGFFPSMVDSLLHMFICINCICDVIRSKVEKNQIRLFSAQRFHMVNQILWSMTGVSAYSDVVLRRNALFPGFPLKWNHQHGRFFFGVYILFFLCCISLPSFRITAGDNWLTQHFIRPVFVYHFAQYAVLDFYTCFTTLIISVALQLLFGCLLLGFASISFAES